MAKEGRKGCQNKVKQHLEEFITEVYQILNESLLSWKFQNLQNGKMVSFISNSPKIGIGSDRVI